MTLVSGVIQDTNITLKAGCVDNYGVLCTETGAWTVIQPDGATLYNNTAGENEDYGISNFTIWLNETGVWFVYVNFTSQNVTREYNIMVETYETPTITTISEDQTMTGIYILIGLIILGTIYTAFQLGKDHQVMKWLMLAVGIMMMPLAVQIARLGVSDTNLQSLLDTALIVYIYIVSIMALYVFIYAVFYVLLRRFFKKDGNKKHQD